MSLFEFLKTELGYDSQQAKDTVIAFLFGLDLTKQQQVAIYMYFEKFCY